MLIDAAIDGQGIALARTTLAAWDLIGGRIVRPFDLSWPPAGTYWIVYPRAMAKVAKIGRFRDWLLAEAADDPGDSARLSDACFVSCPGAPFAATRATRPNVQ